VSADHIGIGPAGADFALSLKLAINLSGGVMTTENFHDLFGADGNGLGTLRPLPEDLSFFPDGWMLPLELTVLYNLALHSDGDILEIGSWIGRSSTALALGLRDAGHKSLSYDIVDFGLVSMAEAMDELRIGMEYVAQEVIARPIMSPGGIVGCLIDNLRCRSLLPHVTSIIRGNVAAVPLRSTYHVVMCDAVHNEREIDIVAPVLARVVRPGTWLMCDDLVTPELVRSLERFIAFDRKIELKDHDPDCKAMVGRVTSISG
jgi:hypothetical protein